MKLPPSTQPLPLATAPLVTKKATAAVGGVRVAGDALRLSHATLKVVSYNIAKGVHTDGPLVGQDAVKAIVANIAAHGAEVVCLQEVRDRRQAEEIARRLGLPSVYYMSPQALPGLPAGLPGTGNAILSAHPISNAEHVPFDTELSLSDRAAIAAKGAIGMLLNRGSPLTGEPAEFRSFLQVTITKGDREITVINTHLTLRSASENAYQIGQLEVRARQLERAGHTVVIAGDLNTHMGLAGSERRPDARGRRPVADAPGVLATATDTNTEWSERYPGSLGNIGEPLADMNAGRLSRRLQSHWEAAKRTTLVAGLPVSPEDALGQLKAGRTFLHAGHFVTRQEAERNMPGVSVDFADLRLPLMDALDGHTHGAAHKRFDNIFVSRTARIAAVAVGERQEASDHDPVAIEIQL